ncbi:hypothetical protein KLP40_09455 [Hymenobacter sp. NST-14]|uniref:hypothetical protein n=1 Tax=Hymenobacter piscis TaxID=2839984 RepID=UPI001C02E6BB|nr:hypothetical protein [Hymenobacter piscis]MBT9393388.1 hypothetical protein [Hymenobacter piscis]
MNPLACLLLAAALPLAATAQTAPADSATTYRHQLGLTASPVLDGFFKNNRSLPLGLMYKRQTKPNQALRVRAQLLYRYFEQVAPLQIGEEYHENVYRVEAALGKEYWLPISSRFISYAGGEIGAYYDNNQRNSKRYQQIQVRNPSTGQLEVTKGYVKAKQHFSTTGILLQPFAGIRFRLSARLYTELESAIVFNWSRTHFKLSEKVFEYTTGLPADYSEGKGDNTYYNFRVNLHPINSLHLIFLF